MPVSADYLKVTLPDKDFAIQKDESDGKLYVWSHKNNVHTWHAAKIDEVEVVFDLGDDTDYRLLPQLIAEWIAHKAAADFWTEAHDGSVNQKLEAVSLRRQTRWLNTQGDLGNVRDASGFTTISSAVPGSFDPRTQSAN